MRIWKQPFEITDLQAITMPSGSRLLHAAVQNGKPHIWFMCDEDAPLVERQLAIYGTGNPLPSNDHIGIYVATFQAPPFVWHVFDLGERR